MVRARCAAILPGMRQAAVSLLAVIVLCGYPARSVPPEAGTPDQDDIFLATSADAAQFAIAPDPLFRKGSSPELIRLARSAGAYETGAFLLYFVDFSTWSGRPHTERLAMASSADGATWSEKTALRFDDAFQGGRATDPSLVQLDDGRLRLYFMTPGRTRGTREIRSATSRDGVNFAMDSGVRISGPGNVDVYRAAETWYMFLGDEVENVTVLAVSEDGLAWTWAPEFRIPGICPAALPYPDGRALLFLNHRGISSFLFDPVTRSCTKESGGVIRMNGIVGDPSPEWCDSGVVLAFKRRSTPGFTAPRRAPR